MAEGSEQDMRFVYCACAIAYILDDWSGIDLLAMKRFIHSCLVRPHVSAFHCNTCC